jgi:hypothetical protein
VKVSSTGVLLELEAPVSIIVQTPGLGEAMGLTVYVNGDDDVWAMLKLEQLLFVPDGTNANERRNGDVLQPVWLSENVPE